jgi:hypothetical protein
MIMKDTFMMRSIKQMYGDKLGATDGDIGHRFSGKEVQIPTRMVDRISYPDSTVFVNLTREAVEQGLVNEASPSAAVA